MKLASYGLRAGALDAAAPRSAWILSEDALVDIEHAYVWLCHQRQRPVNEAFRAQICNLTKFVTHSAADGRWEALAELYKEWTAARAAAGEALPGERTLSEVALRRPFVPKTFRDFYAFERHVATCRARRGQDMVPEWYQFPVFYFSNPNNFRGPDEAISAPRGCMELDFELEVACVLKQPGVSIPAERADEFIAGYLILNDWSARDIQRAEVKVGLGPAKGKDFATSFGPWLVTPDELTDVAESSPAGIRHRLEMTAAVNGRTVSRGNLADLHFTFAEMIERASADVEMYAGDVIGSGTVGTGCILELGPDVQDWLRPGDVVELSVERLGTLRSPIATAHRGGER